ncbi:DUF1972 domain-containing protein [Pannonibacter sp. I15F10I1]|uniref:glycosyltransferase n=1 Tax=Pannonibacter sp. I15F10I1 TaxID=2003580 RepID=UPI001AD8B4A6|nr:DUF1972 domain-containing protein [Pannonibacter sp. I15F10I1]
MTEMETGRVSADKTLNILGIRGLPAAHGGFETFAAKLAPYLRDRGWTVNVYCQVDDGSAPAVAPYHEDDWEGIHRIHIGVKRGGPVGTIEFDWKCTRDVLKRPGIDLVLGYNTAIFTILQRLKGRRVVMNMDGIEWKRAKWSLPAKAWFFINEIVGAHVCSTPIADHPEIAAHLRRIGCRRSVVIPYGADEVTDGNAELLVPYGLSPNEYFVSIARIEPENSILEIVRAFSKTARGMKLAVLGNMDPNNPYHRAVRKAGSPEVVFLGAIYDKATVEALRVFCRAYLHGHQVGGTNPSLVEALGCGCAVIAHDNRFNRWVAGDGQVFFSDVQSCEEAIGLACQNNNLEHSRIFARDQHKANFQWLDVLTTYADTFLRQETLEAPPPAKWLAPDPLQKHIEDGTSSQSTSGEEMKQ